MQYLYRCIQNSLEATEIMKKILALAMAAVMLFSSIALVGCSDEKSEDKGPIIQVYLADLPTSLDPTAVSYGSVENVKLFGLLYEGLFTIDEDGKLENAVADEYEFYVDPLDNTLKLEITLDDTRWSDSTPVVADDFVYAWQRLLKPGTNNSAASLLYPIKNAQAVKEGTCSINDLGVCSVKDKVLQISFEKDFVNVEYFLRRLASPVLVPLKENSASKFDDPDNLDYLWSVSDEVNAIPVTNGAFKIKKINSTTLELERNLHYKSVSTVDSNSADKVVKPHKLITLYSEGKTADDQLERFNSKSTEHEERIFYINLSSADEDTIKGAGKKVEQTSVPSTYTYFFDTTSELFSDARVRKALSIALDRDHINSLTGRDTKAAEGIVPFGVEDTMQDTDFRKEGGNLYKYSTSKSGELKVGDIETAKALLKEAGISKGKITIEYNSQRAYEKPVAEYVRRVWQELGFTVVASGKNGKFINNIASGSTVLTTGENRVVGMDFQCVTPDAYGMLLSFSEKYSGTAVDLTSEEISYGMNFTGFADAEYDAICDEIVGAVSYDARAEAMHKAEEYLVENSPAIGLFNNVDVYASNNLDKISSDMFGRKSFTKVTMKDYKKYLPEDEEIAAPDTADDETEAE